MLHKLYWIVVYYMTPNYESIDISDDSHETIIGKRTTICRN